ncbi:MAG TPA: sporulation protein [Clostridiales bacterium]|nr:sporulation protein [Clostridiales bacterium]
MLGELFDIPKSAMPGVMQIELAGNTEAVVSGCTGVLEYDENTIRLSGGKMNVRFTGRNLQIKVLTHDSAIITGFILNVEFIAL